MAEINYTDRVVDVFCSYAQPQGPVVARMTSEGEGGLVVTGILRLAQNVMMELLTERGSVPYFPEKGTFLLAALREGLVITPIELTTITLLALTAAAENVKKRESPQDKPDERLKSIKLVRADVVNRRAILVIRIVSEAENNRSIFLPLALPLGPSL